MIKYERPQVVRNIAIGLATLIRSFRLGLGAMFFRPDEVEAILTEACTMAMRDEKLLKEIKIEEKK